MNSKPVILAAFGIWAFICARWYVCQIKDVCNNETSIEEPIQTPGIERDTAETSAEIKALNSNEGSTASPSTNSAPLNNTDAKVTPDNMDNVQMEKIEDRMVIHFPYKSSRREDDDAIDGYLNSLASHLISSGEKVRITGHTDFVGEQKTNYNFGLLRANSIRDLLIKKGVPKAQIVCKSYGETKPIATNDTPYGRYLNRRAEIRVGK